MFGTLVGADGLAYVDGETRRRIESRVVMIVTDERIVFAADQEDGDAGSLDYAELASVRTDDEQIVFTTCDGVRCELPLFEEGTDIDAALAHLRWIGTIRGEVIACRNDVDLAVGEINDHASAMEWEKAETKYADLRRKLDELVVRLGWTEPVPDDVLAPEITDLERSLEGAYARMLLERAESELDVAEQLLENEAFDRMQSVLYDAETYLDRARSHAAALERGDNFQFGEQREIHGALDRVAERIEDLGAEPLERARKAKRHAEAADEAETAIEHLETSLQRYRDLRGVDLDYGPEDIGNEAASVAVTLTEEHRELARIRWNAGTDYKQEGSVERAISRWSEAVEHIDRAAELAEEFDHEDTEDIEAQAKRLAETLASLRDAAGSDDAPAEDDGGSVIPHLDSGGSDSYTLSGLANSLTLDILTGKTASDGGRRTEDGDTDGHRSETGRPANEERQNAR